MMVAAERRRVLVIEDEIDFRETLELVLAQAGLEVVAVGSGAAAVEAVRGDRFHLVITDLRMPGLSGADTISAIRELDAVVPVIVATGYATEEISAECIARGAAHFLKKPFDVSQFVGLVFRVLG